MAFIRYTILLINQSIFLINQSIKQNPTIILSSFSIITHFPPLLIFRLPLSPQLNLLTLSYFSQPLTIPSHLMYVTGPLRKSKNLKAQKKHHNFIFKEIQQNVIFQSIKQEQQLRKSNGFKSFKHKVLKNNAQNSFRKTHSTLRRASLTTDKFKCHRKSVSSIFSTSLDKTSNEYFKTAEDFFDHKKFQTINQVIHEKPQERQSQSTALQDNNIAQTNFDIEEQQKENKQTSYQETCQRPIKIAQHNKSRKKVTLLDLKVKNIEHIINNAGRSQHMDFGAFVQKDQKSITKSCWKNFMKDMVKNGSKQPQRVQEKIRTLRKTATSQKKRNILQPQNGIQQLFLHKKPNKLSKSQSASLANTPRSTNPSSNLQPNLHNKPNPLQSQQIHQYFNFIRGFQNQDQFSKKMSLGLYRKSILKYYILKNTQEAVKASAQYKKIAMDNLKHYKPEEVLFFMYLNDNQYKFQNKKNQGYMREVVP